MAFLASNRSQFLALKEWFYTPDGESYREQKYKERLAEAQKNVLVPENSKRVGFTINKYRSGEVTGGRFSTGLESQMNLVPRSGPLVTDSLTQAGKTKIRRSIQCSDVEFHCFMTVTFDVRNIESENIESYRHPMFDGFMGPVFPVVNQRWAKEKFKRFLNSIKVAYDRKSKVSGRANDRIAYVWVAELQANGNIHFHVLLNHRIPIKWLTALWGQAKNSINVKPIKNVNHASCYIRKYIEKDKSVIEGNRYGISQQLRATMKPEKKSSEGRQMTNEIMEIVNSMRDTIEINGGVVIDHGFYIPTPSRSSVYRDKEGKKRKTVAVSKQLAPYLIKDIESLINSNPF